MRGRSMLRRSAKEGAEGGIAGIAGMGSASIDHSKCLAKS